MSETFEGGCSCGAVRFRLASRPMFTNCCHCLDCQNQTGSAFAINAVIETARIALLAGEPVKAEAPSPSGRGHDIYRCGKCGVALWSDYGRRSYLRFVRVATLDDPHSIKPDAHVFTRSKVPWVQIPPDQPAFEIFYDIKAEWPADSMARRDAASASAKA